MKFTTTTMLAGALAASPYLASAFPMANSVPVTGAHLEELQKRHAEVEKRQAQLLELAVGVFLSIAAESAGETLAGSIANALTAAFGGDDAPWSNGDNCQVKFSTHGGVRSLLLRP